MILAFATAATTYKELAVEYASSALLNAPRMISGATNMGANW
jgi:hypothetical protein